MQGNVDGNFNSFSQTARHIIKNEGASGLFKGVAWRTGSIALAVLIIREAKSHYVCQSST
jgi:hypothetical protein